MAKNRYYDDESSKQGIDGYLIKRLLQFCKPHWKKFLVCFFVALICVGLSLIGPQITKLLMDRVFPEKSVNLAILVVVIVTVVMFSERIFLAWRDVMISRIGYKIIYKIRKDLFDHLQTLSLNFFDTYPTGKILVRVTSYIDGLTWMLSFGIVQAAGDCVTLVGLLIVMLLMNPKLTVISFLTVIPIMVFIVFYRNKMEITRVAVRNKVSNRNAYVHENIMGVYTTQAFNRVPLNAQEMDHLNRQVKDTYLRQVLLANTLGPVLDVFGVISLFITYLLGYQMITGDILTPGELAAFATYIGRFWQPINSMSVIYSNIVSNMSNAEKIFETIDTKPEIEDAENAYELPPIKGEVVFDHVTFGYEKDVTVLKDVSFTVKPGQTIALVGPTGAGKTTLVSLLSRFYDPQEGVVLLDGHDIRKVTQKSLRHQVTVMMQDSFIFSGNIIENIRYGRPDATDEECIQAAKSVYADEFISQLPDGYYTKVEERGAGLSAGERQLLSFARTILADPRVIILDEATSAIDTKTEILIQKALASLLKGRTSFIIAHRLSTIRNADKIMVIANHGIAEAGTHQELMEKDGLYAELNRSQTKRLVG